jgi:hypothetical protein
MTEQNTLITEGTTMNAKKAKALRRYLRSIIAEKAVEGGKPIADAKYIENERNRKYAGAGDDRKLIAAGTIRASTDSDRGVYLALKKALIESDQAKLKVQA